MPRKTKEINEEKTVKKESKLNKKTDAVLDSEKTVVAKKTTKKSTTKAKTPGAKTTKAKTATKSEKVPPKKTTKLKAEDKEKKTTKKTTKSTATKTTKKTTKGTSTKATKAASKSVKTTKAKTATKTKTTTKKAVKASPTVVEYYDLPYKYNQTVVKVLYQNPTTLFVYWEISDSDIENYKKQYGENFLETTRPVLVVYNNTLNYSFEVPINDFANSWYFNINDSKCDYRVELIRKPIAYNEKIKTDYIYITSSNKVESPNDKILFSTDEPYTVYFRNTKNGSIRKVNLPKLLERLNLTNKDFGFPIVRNVYDLYKNIYHIDGVEEFSISLTNPSSGNPSSHSLSSRFI